MVKQITLAIFFMLTMAVISSFYTYHAAVKATPKLVTLDTKKVLQDFIVDAAKSKLEGDELSQYISSYTKSLENITEELARQENLIIMPSGAVIAGDIDITAQVEQLIKKGYGNKGEVK